MGVSIPTRDSTRTPHPHFGFEQVFPTPDAPILSSGTPFARVRFLPVRWARRGDAIEGAVKTLQDARDDRVSTSKDKFVRTGRCIGVVGHLRAQRSPLRSRS